MAFVALAVWGCGGAKFSAAPGDAGTTDSSADVAGGDATRGPSWCEREVPAHEFCADFDESTNPAVGWAGADPGVNTIGIVSVPPSERSPPNALLFATPNPPVARASYFLRRPLLPGSTHFTVAFDIKFDSSCVQAGGYISVLNLELGPVGTYHIDLINGPAGTSLLEHFATPPDKAHFFTTALSGSWQRVVITASPGSDDTASVTVDGMTELDTTLSVPSTFTPTELRVGLYDDGLTLACTVQFDNVTFDEH